MTSFLTLFYKELLRFWKVLVQTVAAPVLNVAIETPFRVVPASSDLAPWAVMFPVTALTPAPPTS